MIRRVLSCVNSPWAYELRPGLIKVGRNPTNDFKHSDPSVSSFHVELMVEGAKIMVRDLGSTNGTFLNDLKIDEGELRGDSRLRLGNVEMHLEEVPVVDTTFIRKSDMIASAETRPMCASHKEAQASYWCERCSGYFCNNCVKVVGHDRANGTTMTVCPLCNGQCNHLPELKTPKQEEKSLLGRLTQTLKLPFAR